MGYHLVNTINPDSASISQKLEILMPVSLVDVSASGNFGKIRTNYTGRSQVVTIPDMEYLDSSSYYTPIYKEKLRYDVWLNTINKNFEELE